jgi:putative FmdB family regulatory protein
MPTYEYGCEACGKTWELEQRITESPIKKCPKCGKLKARRLISGGTFMLKGGGWYADGYGTKAPAKTDKADKVDKPDKAAAKSDSGGESKGDSKAAKSSSGASDS